MAQVRTICYSLGMWKMRRNCGVNKNASWTCSPIFTTTDCRGEKSGEKLLRPRNPYAIRYDLLAEHWGYCKLTLATETFAIYWKTPAVNLQSFTCI